MRTTHRNLSCAFYRTFDSPLQGSWQVSRHRRAPSLWRMKQSTVLGLVVAIFTTFQAYAHAHGHAHGHAHKNLHAHERKALLERDLVEKDTVVDHITVTVLECWLGNEPISEFDCNQGIANGTLVWASDGEVEPAGSSTIAVTIQSSAAATSAAAASPSAAASGSGLSSTFPDGEIPCSSFPASYGAVALPWIGLGGWAGVQQPGSSSSSGFSDIMGVTPSQCNNGVCCLEGAYCSYACPPGSQKFQWPSEQGGSGQSVGGVLCQGGKLYKTNPAVQTLCGPGTTVVNVQVQNKLSQNVAICRTDYPGDEGMYIPVDSQPGTTLPLTCPDGSNYFQWEGKVTSAQYYINKPGYPITQGCTWGSAGDDWGNWAPAVLGVGYSAGEAWLSIMPNTPTQMTATLPYTITLTGDNLSGNCRYQNGQYCTGSNYQTCSSNGCTVSSSAMTFLNNFANVSL